MESKKRKREAETETAIITFHAPNGRTFSRLFRESSLDGTRESVRRKLDLAGDAEFTLAQLRNNVVVDLEDDDDFAAFRALARTNSSLDVLVTVDGQPQSDLLHPGHDRPEPSAAQSLAVPGQASGPSRSMAGSDRVPLDILFTSPPAASTPSQSKKKGKVRKSKSVSEQTSQSSTPAPDPFVSKILTVFTPPWPKQTARKTGGPSLQRLAVTGHVERPFEASDKATGNTTEIEAEKPKKKKRKADNSVSHVEAVTDSAQTTPVPVKSKKRKMIVIPENTQPLPSSSEHDGPSSPAQEQHFHPQKSHLAPAADPHTTDFATEPVAKKKKKQVSSSESEVLEVQTGKQKKRADTAETGDAPREQVNEDTTTIPPSTLMKKKRGKGKKSAASAEDITQGAVEPHRDYIEVQPAPAPRKNNSKKRLAAEETSPISHTAPVGPAANTDSGTASPAPHAEAEGYAALVTKKKLQPSKRGKQDSQYSGETAAEAAPTATPSIIVAGAGAPQKTTRKKQVTVVQDSTPGSLDTLPPIVSSNVTSSGPKPNQMNKGKKAQKKLTARAASPESQKAVELTIQQVVSRRFPKVTPVALDDPPPVAQLAAETTASPAAQSPSAQAGSPDSQNAAGPTVPQNDLSTATQPVTKKDMAQASTQVSPATLKPQTSTAVSKSHTSKPDEAEKVSGTPVGPVRDTRPPGVDDAGQPSVQSSRPTNKRAALGRTNHARCPLCLETPFHLRYQCPVIVAGVGSIQSRITELEESGGSIMLIRELRAFLEKPQRKTVQDSAHVQGDNEKSSPIPAAGMAPEPSATSPEIPIIGTLPAGSKISEVIIEGKDDGSSSESSDSDDSSDEDEEDDDEEDDEEDEEEDVNEAKDGPLSSFKRGPTLSRPLEKMSLEELMRGPALSRSVLDMLPSESGSEEEEDSVEEKLASEEEEKEERQFRRLSKRFERGDRSSDEERSPDHEPANDAASIPMDADAEHQTPWVLAKVGTGSLTTDESGATGPPLIGTSANGVADVPKDVEARSTMTSPGQGGSVYMTPVSDGRDSQPPEEVVPSSDPAEALRSIPDKSSSTSAKAPATKNSVPQTQSVSADKGTQDSAQKVPQATQSKDTTLMQTPSVRPASPEIPLAAKGTLIDDIEPIEEPTGLDDDPIEPSLTQIDRNTTPPPLPLQRPATTKKMKDRSGKIRHPDGFPILASEALARARSSSERTTASSLKDAQPARLNQATSVAPELQATLKATGKAPQSSQQPPSPAAPKRRGRPPLSVEEKARRAAEKERVAAEKKAAKEEKARLKAAEKTGKGAQSLSTKAPSLSARPASVSQSNALPEFPRTPATAPARQTQEAPSSAVKWTTLSPSQNDGEISMVDELRSSSPPPASAPAFGVDEAESTTTRPAPSQTQAQTSSRRDIFTTPLNKANGATSATPLPPPSESQLNCQPNTSVLATQSSFLTRLGAESRSQDLSSIQKPMRPASSWVQALPRLSVLATGTQFSPLSVHPIPIPGTGGVKRSNALYSQEEEDSESDSEDSDSDSDSDSESGEGLDSHVPRGREAGAKRR